MHEETTDRGPALDQRKKWILLLLSLGAGALPLSYRFLAGDLVRISYSLIVLVAFLWVTVEAKRRSSLQRFWPLSLAFTTYALFGLLNNLASYFAPLVLNQSPVNGDPLASTIWGSVAVQVLETACAIVPIVLITRMTGKPLSSVYIQKGKVGLWLVVAIVVFVVVFTSAALGGPSSRFFSLNGTMTLSRFLGLAPALLVMVITNGFQEELLLRGQFLQKYQSFFSPNLSNIVQALVFAMAHLTVSYTPSAVIFSFAYAFPLGLVTGFLMQRTNSILAPAILHAGLDIAIYLSFLSYVS